MEVHDSLPYIDQPITDEDRALADKLIRRELPRDHASIPHPSLSPLPPTNFSPLIQTELSLHASGLPTKKGIDTTRYELPDAPSPASDITAWRTALRTASTLNTYLSGRLVNLQLLEELGKNAWLISNAELEGILKQLETELADVKEQTDEVNRGKKGAQEGSRGELLGLEDTWKKGVARMIETQIATEQLREELRERRRQAAG